MFPEMQNSLFLMALAQDDSSAFSHEQHFPSQVVTKA
jgi:hypothetical protein